MKKILNILFLIFVSVACFGQLNGECCETINETGFWFFPSQINATQISVQLYVDGVLADEVVDTYNGYYVAVGKLAKYQLIVQSNSYNLNWRNCEFSGTSCISVIGNQCCYSFGFGDNPKTAHLPSGKIVSAECSVVELCDETDCSEPCPEITSESVTYENGQLCIKALSNGFSAEINGTKYETETDCIEVEIANGDTACVTANSKEDCAATCPILCIEFSGEAEK